MLTIHNHLNSPVNFGDALAAPNGSALMAPSRLLNNPNIVSSLRSYMAAGNITVSRGSLTLTDAQVYALQSDDDGSVFASLGVDVPGAALGIYGDGSDGAVVLDGTAAGSWGGLVGVVYTLTRDLMASSLVVAAGYVLAVGGFRVFSRDSVEINGTVRANGSSGAGGGAGGAAGAAVAAGSVAGCVAGGAANAFVQGVAGSNVTTAMGGAGGAGGAGDGGAARAGGTATVATAVHGSLRMLPAALYAKFDAASTALANGGAGGSGGSGDNVAFTGGGGGGGGGVLVMASTSIVVGATGIVSADGGSGGDGQVDATTGGGGGGGGGGGLVILISNSLTERTGSIVRAAGGAAGAAGGPTGLVGVAGSAGVVIRLSNSL